MTGRGCHIWLFRAVLVVLLASVQPEESSARPMRIVSMNVCADQLLLLLADREQIASLSFLSRDEATSTMVTEAAGLPINHGLSEEILPLKPDLILAGEYTTQPTLFLLRRLGYPVIELPIANTLEDIRANIRTVAKAIGAVPKGEALITAFDQKIDTSEKQDAEGNAPVAALYWAHGFTSGKGTLANAIVTAAGLKNLGSELGLQGTAQVPLEILISSAPDIIVINKDYDAPARATEVFRHPALQRAFADYRHLSIPANKWVCGTPVVADIIIALHEAKSSINSASIGKQE